SVLALGALITTEHPRGDFLSDHVSSSSVVPRTCALFAIRSAHYSCSPTDDLLDQFDHSRSGPFDGRHWEPIHAFSSRCRGVTVHLQGAAARVGTEGLEAAQLPGVSGDRRQAGAAAQLQPREEL